MPTDTSPLSLEGALQLMRVAPTADNSSAAQAEKAPAAEAAPASAEKKDEDQNQPEAANADTAAESADADKGEKDTPPETEGKTDDEGADQGDALPPIEPPSSWKAEEKAVWKSLPRAAQEAIQRREQDRTTELRNLQNSTAEQRKTVDAEVTKLKELTTKIDAHISNEVAELAKEFPELKTEADVEALALRDPARFSVFQAKLMRFNSVRQAQAEAQQELGRRQQQQQAETNERVKALFIKEFPTWSDPAVARKEITELQDYAISVGVPEDVARAGASPYTYKFAQKAMLYDRAQAAKAKALERQPPRAAKPGVQSATPKEEARAADRATRLNRLSKSGDIEDARGLLRM
jgi:hypothetical protein